MAAQLMREREVAETTGIPAETLRYMRGRGEGPPAFKIGRNVYFHREDVDAWIESKRNSTAISDTSRDGEISDIREQIRSLSARLDLLQATRSAGIEQEER